ncbi:MAG: hypothetical protein WGN25_11895 [Candidatus Electrothrix sp. GW3-4]|uniref:hypothetical protein n=1 Tax=Candidatus Electrothrix sp. GW3-4 TaxID=3126740 RepID=UPI0030CE173E
MTTNKQKIHAFERAIELIEMSAKNNPSLVSDKAYQALYNTYGKLTEMFMTSDERKANNFLTMELGCFAFNSGARMP